jgi:hypothetical protein
MPSRPPIAVVRAHPDAIVVEGFRMPSRLPIAVVRALPDAIVGVRSPARRRGPPGTSK